MRIIIHDRYQEHYEQNANDSEHSGTTTFSFIHTVAAPFLYSSHDSYCSDIFNRHDQISRLVLHAVDHRGNWIHLNQVGRIRMEQMHQT
jgi:hypothetical protein